MPQDDDLTTALDARLDQVTATLESMGLTVVRRTAYADDLGDGTGALGWLWARAEPRRFPDETFDVAITYSAADGTWTLGTPTGAGYSSEESEDAGSTVHRLLTWKRPQDAPARTIPEWMWVVLGGAGTGVVLPFVTAMIEKSAEDAYTALRAIFAKRKPGDPNRLSILDPDHDLHIIGPDPLPEAAVRQLALMAPEVDGHVLIWDDETQTWQRYRRQA
ncbi:hypothetical protein [Saccharothrix obliqua]|uniref:hypothetical protein n=1 Tax=Saccharothrix obliqua TaxID=2861747 RepID=UPI001C5CC8A0|nr:hypothetical protein [Saccharothrix obliqua]MBW4722161.1 hypothetical protein [Saccharothrix obliqua]